MRWLLSGVLMIYNKIEFNLQSIDWCITWLFIRVFNGSTIKKLLFISVVPLSKIPKWLKLFMSLKLMLANENVRPEKGCASFSVDAGTGIAIALISRQMMYPSLLKAEHNRISNLPGVGSSVRIAKASAFDTVGNKTISAIRSCSIVILSPGDKDKTSVSAE